MCTPPVHKLEHTYMYMSMSMSIPAHDLPMHIHLLPYPRHPPAASMICASDKERGFGGSRSLPHTEHNRGSFGHAHAALVLLQCLGDGVPKLLRLDYPRVKLRHPCSQREGRESQSRFSSWSVKPSGALSRHLSAPILHGLSKASHLIARAQTLSNLW